MRKRKSGASTNILKADMSQTPTEQTPLNTSPIEEINNVKFQAKNICLYIENTFNFAHS